MGSGILLIWVGALLIICGVIYGAAQALRRGSLSEVNPGGMSRSEASLEPRESMRSFSLKAHGPALGLIILGSILILAETVF
jgi:hypothetical protein